MNISDMCDNLHEAVLVVAKVGFCSDSLFAQTCCSSLDKGVRRLPACHYFEFNHNTVSSVASVAPHSAGITRATDVAFLTVAGTLHPLVVQLVWVHCLLSLKVGSGFGCWKRLQCGGVRNVNFCTA